MHVNTGQYTVNVVTLPSNSEGGMAYYTQTIVIDGLTKSQARATVRKLHERWREALDSTVEGLPLAYEDPAGRLHVFDPARLHSISMEAETRWVPQSEELDLELAAD